ncbi:hypothetical protein PCN94_07690, partial [Streptococcus suis]|uniref:hypothetical protein n=1 Tax=Streptococcus suis TaxID=1307 RepID=UPI0025B10357
LKGWQEGLFILSRWGGFSIKTAIFSKNSKKDKHQNDVCLQSEPLVSGFLYKWVTPRFKLEMRNVGRRFSLYQGPRDLFKLEIGILIKRSPSLLLSMQ